MKNYLDSIYFDYNVLKKQIQEIIPGESVEEKVFITNKLFFVEELIQSVEKEPKNESDLNSITKKLFLVKNIMNTIQNWYYFKKFKPIL